MLTTTHRLDASSIDDALVDHERLNALLDDLLTLARLDDPATVTATRRVDLGDLITECVARSADHRLRAKRVDRPAFVVGRSSQLRRVITNLTDNALAACREVAEGSVRLEGDDVTLRVDDDGPGIAPADRERAFDRFVRLDEARTAERGTGLGLAIVREIVREHNGHVEIGDSPSGACRVTLRLPRPAAH